MDKQKLVQKYPPSPTCSCPVCQSYCARPGWWTVEEAIQAIESDYASRMMLEMSRRSVCRYCARPGLDGEELSRPSLRA
jgi:hypothetical protein